MTIGSLMKHSALSDNWSWKHIIGRFESGRFTQVLLYQNWQILVLSAQRLFV